jgi:FdhD protein
MLDAPRPGRTAETAIVRYDGARERRTFDAVATEEPLEIRLSAGGETTTLAVTMRTPGNDFELAAGFTFAESIVRDAAEIADVRYCVDPTVDPEQRYNIVTVGLRANRLPDVARLERHFTVNSSCGVCGKAHLDALRDLGCAALDDTTRFSRAAISQVPARMRDAQRVFEATGGLHAAALFAPDGEILAVREDIGRHNAVDKLLGWSLLERRGPLAGLGLMVSGRASYEIVQKAAVARVPLIAAVSAPSSLAVELARAFNVTLLGFVRGDTGNAYAAAERLIP